MGVLVSQFLVKKKRRTGCLVIVRCREASRPVVSMGITIVNERNGLELIRITHYLCLSTIMQKYVSSFFTCVLCFSKYTNSNS